MAGRSLREWGSAADAGIGEDLCDGLAVHEGHALYFALLFGEAGALYLFEGTDADVTVGIGHGEIFGY